MISLFKSTLSILVALLLLIGLSTYRNLLSKMELNAILNQLHYIDHAVVTFKSKYNALPGDITNTENLGLSEMNTDGNGDGRITNFDYYNQAISDRQPISARAEGELLYFWQHLLSAELIHSQYGVFPVLSRQAIRIVVFSTDFGHYYQLGMQKIDNNDNLILSNSALTPALAQRIDVKLDDGIAFSGKIQAISNDTDSINNFIQPDNSCITTVGYNINNLRKSCQLRIQTQF